MTGGGAAKTGYSNMTTLLKTLAPTLTKKSQLATTNQTTETETETETKTETGTKEKTHTHTRTRTPANIYVRNAAGDLVCPTCGVTKKRHNTMFYHMKKHSGEKKYVCTECDAGFVQKSGLDQHCMLAHSSVQTNWLCPCCTHVCSNKYNMLIHIGRRHGEGWIPPLPTNGECLGCHRSYASATAYAYHATCCFAEDAPFSLELACTRVAPVSGTGTV